LNRPEGPRAAAPIALDLAIVEGYPRFMDGIVEKLRAYFEGRDDISFAVLFGSRAKGLAGEDSDVDIAVYFRTSGRELDLESEDEPFPGEDALWSDLERILGTPVDLLVLNRAAASVAAAALIEGAVVHCEDELLYGRYLNAATVLAEDERRFAESYLEVKARSRSLSEIDRDRLARIVDFIGTELADSESVASISRAKYLGDSAFRRNVERWVENLVNASIDAAKILIAANRQAVPQTYRETLLRLSSIPEFAPGDPEELAAFSKLRNLLAHEYLDLRYPSIENFVLRGPPLFRRLADTVSRITERTETDNK
jgi:predicted nucleotidyltransferase/uncharacterized protein YutE (UPF0331/DUF86 family)